MFVDSHCHLTGNDLTDEDLEARLGRARDAGVAGMVAVGCTVEDDRRVLAVVHSRRNLAASLGVHPHEASTWEAGTDPALEALLRDEAVRFVGETGLDWHYDLSPRETQETVFRDQIRLALRVRKPLMIHTREAPDLTLRILTEEGAGVVGGIIHCFSEDLAFARQALDLGFHLSFSGIVTFKNAQGIRDVAAWAPLDRILVETDSPFLAPVPHRGKPNEPAFVTLVAAQVAALRGMAPERLGEITTHNLEALCGWSPSA